jgi:competence protein ComEA
MANNGKIVFFVRVREVEKLPRQVQIIILVCLGVFIFFGGLKYQARRFDDFELEITAEEIKEIEPREIVVHVVGAVERPGVYTFVEGARVAEVIEKAGPTAEADLSKLNLALPLLDGKQIRVPSQEESEFVGVPAEEQLGSVSQVSGLININTAGVGELTELPQIGPVIAQRIIAYRQEQGPFQKPEDLTQVAGIGEKTFQKLQSLITVN